MTDESAPARDLTAAILGAHPFPLRVCFGDERRRAFVAAGPQSATLPGVQVATPAVDKALAEAHRIDAPALRRAAAGFGKDPPFLLNVACQNAPEAFERRLRNLAAAAGGPEIGADDWRVLNGLKLAVDAAHAIGPNVIMKAAMAYLAHPAHPDGSAYGTLVDHVNRALTNPARNPRVAREYPPVASVDDIGPGGLQLWWVKEGSATIVFQVEVDLQGGRPPVRFVLNVAKDTTTAADELRQVFADFVDFYGMEPRFVMEPYGFGDVGIDTWRGPAAAAVLAAEWFEGHELHVYEGDSQLYVWLDQRMGRDHPLGPAVSDRIWEQTVRMRARYTRVTAQGPVPIATHVNAGDYIFRERPDGEWDVLLIWARRAPAGLDPGDFLVLAGLLSGVNVFGADVGRTVWWDQPERALAALREGLLEAGLDEAGVNQLLQRAYDGPFTQFADRPQLLPYNSLVQTADPQELQRIFLRAKRALAAHLRR